MHIFRVSNVYETAKAVLDDMIIVGNDREKFEFLKLPVVPDIGSKYCDR